MQRSQCRTSICRWFATCHLTSVQQSCWMEATTSSFRNCSMGWPPPINQRWLERGLSVGCYILWTSREVVYLSISMYLSLSIMYGVCMYLSSLALFMSSFFDDRYNIQTFDLPFLRTQGQVEIFVLIFRKGNRYKIFIGIHQIYPPLEEQEQRVLSP